MLGIANYEPTFYEDAEAFRSAHGPRLRQLVGGTVQNAWAVWSAVDDKWFPDAPVILNVGDQQIEMAAYQLGFAVTWNIIDRKKDILWCVDEGDNDGLGLYWKEQVPQPLQFAIGKQIEQVELSEFHTIFPTKKDWLLSGVVLRFSDGCLAVFNALDELGLSSKPLEQDYVRYISL